MKTIKNIIIFIVCVLVAILFQFIVYNGFDWLMDISYMIYCKYGEECHTMIGICIGGLIIGSIVYFPIYKLINEIDKNTKEMKNDKNNNN